MMRSAVVRTPREPDEDQSPARAVGRQPTYMRAWRESHGLTLERMAGAINELRGWKITGAYLQRIEVGRLQYKQDMLEAYADVLSCTPADLLSRQPRDPDEVWAELSARDKRRALRALANNGNNKKS